jgi:hypothetical protein
VQREECRCEWRGEAAEVRQQRGGSRGDAEARREQRGGSRGEADVMQMRRQQRWIRGVTEGDRVIL